MTDDDLTDLRVLVREAVASTTLDTERVIRQARVAVRTRRQRVRQATTAGVTVLVAAGVAAAVAVGSTAHDGGGRAQVVVAATPTPTGPSRSPQASNPVQPSPRFFPQWSQLSGCPSLEGVTVAPSAGQALSAVESLGHGLSADEEHADRAYWPVLQDSYAARSPSRPSGQFVTARGSDAARADEVSRACGAETLSASTLVRNCTDGEPCTTQGASALDEDYLVLLRRGVPLVFYSSP